MRAGVCTVYVWFSKIESETYGDFIFEEVENKLKYDEFIFGVKQVDDKYYLSETVKKYVLSSGTKNYKAAPGTDPEIARTLLQSMHKMHRSGVDNYVSHKGRLRRFGGGVVEFSGVRYPAATKKDMSRIEGIELQEGIYIFLNEGSSDCKVFFMQQWV